jgi:predicted Zn-dependent protease
MALAALGDPEAAERAFARAAGDDEASPFARPLKIIRDNLKDVEAMEQRAAVLFSKDPADPTGLKIRAQLLVLHGRHLEAAYVLDKLLRDKTQDFAVWILLGCVKARMRQTDQFCNEWPAPPPKPAEVQSPWTELARRCAVSGLWDAALGYLECPAAVAENGPPPLLAVADIAVQFQQPRRAYDYVRRATETYPKSPDPWLKLTDIALTANDLASARQYLSEAESRGAPPDELAKRKEKLGESAAAPSAPTRTIIQ